MPVEALIEKQSPEEAASSRPQILAPVESVPAQVTQASPRCRVAVQTTALVDSPMDSARLSPLHASVGRANTLSQRLA
jgi:hypothetical protein